MIHPWHHGKNKRRGHRVLLFLVLGSFLMANFPLPIPAEFFIPSGIAFGMKSQVQNADEDEDQTPFPCQHGRCGCTTAQKCWTNCCCHTPSERLQWAKKRGVNPPSYAVLSDSPSQKKVASCCSKLPTKTHLQTPSSESSRSCCPKDAPDRFSKQKHRTVLSILACKCKGSSSLFTSLPWFLDLGDCFLQLPMVCSDEPIFLFEPRLKSIADRPPSPPPKSI